MEGVEAFAGMALVVFDFDGVFTDNAVYVDQDGREQVRCWRGDGIGLRALDGVGVAALILSTEVNPVVSARARKLGIDCIQGVEDKLVALRAAAGERMIPLGRVCYVGNDVNDEGCLRAVGLPVVVPDAHEDVLDLGRYVTRARGGYGAVREVCDLITRSRGRRTG